jgi:hypothetical protein
MAMIEKIANAKKNVEENFKICRQSKSIQIFSKPNDSYVI